MKTILITGSNRGLGLELVRQYAQKNWQVIATCRNPEQATALKKLAIVNDGIKIIPLDISHHEQIKKVAQQLVNQPIDILYNNAGIYGQDNATFGHIDPQKWLTTFNINTISVMLMMQAFIDNVLSSDKKMIANMSSKMGSLSDNSSGGSYVYRSSKAALNMICKSAAHDLRAKGITVLAMHPGWVLTDMGGANAEINCETSVKQLIATMDKATLKNSGSFYEIDGSIIPW